MNEFDYDLVGDSLSQLGTINKYIDLESGCRHSMSHA